MKKEFIDLELKECLTVRLFNSFKPNDISPSYQLDQSISDLRVVGWYVVTIFIKILI